MQNELTKHKDDDSKFAAKITSIKSKLEKYKNIEEKFLQIENEKREIERKFECLNEKYNKEINEKSIEIDTKHQVRRISVVKANA